MRLDKLLEQEKIGSKRHVKALIRSKQVTVDGMIAMHESLNVDAALQEIMVNNHRIVQQTHVYYMLNKPKGVITAVKDQKHQTVIDLIKKEEQREGLFPVGRLDRDTEGLLLITDNGQLGYQLSMSHKKVIKCYEVTVNERLTTDDYLAFKKGVIFFDGTKCKPAELEIIFVSDQKSRALLFISEGKFHQVKKMFLCVGKKVIHLKRISMGPLYLDEQLRPGEYRPLSFEELNKLLPYFTIHKKEKRMDYGL